MNFLNKNAKSYQLTAIQQNRILYKLIIHFFRRSKMLKSNQNMQHKVNWNKGHWNRTQQMKYVAFLQLFQSRFQKPKSRRLWKIFKELSDFIGTRSPNQCRSHHEKHIKNYQQIRTVIQYYRKNVASYIQFYQLIQQKGRHFNKTTNGIVIDTSQQNQSQFSQKQIKQVLKQNQEITKNNSQDSKNISQEIVKEQIKENNSLEFQKQNEPVLVAILQQEMPKLLKQKSDFKPFHEDNSETEKLCVPLLYHPESYFHHFALMYYSSVLSYI